MTNEPTNRHERRLLRWSKVKVRVPKSRTQIWRDIRAGKFPAPVQIGENSVAWFEDEIDTYMDALPRTNYTAQGCPTTHKTKARSENKAAPTGPIARGLVTERADG